MNPAKREKLWQLFFAMFKLNLSTFGGGFVVISLMRKYFAEEKGWIEEQEMLDIAAIAQSSPGALAVNAAILVGYRTAGIIGALLSVMGTVAPPLIIISIISMFYESFRNNAIVSVMMAGMLCGAAAVIFDVVMDMVKKIFQEKSLLQIILLPVTFLSVRCCSVNILVVILVCGVIGAACALYREKRLKGGVSQ